LSGFEKIKLTPYQALGAARHCSYPSQTSPFARAESFRRGLMPQVQPFKLCPETKVATAWQDGAKHKIKMFQNGAINSD